MPMMEAVSKKPNPMKANQAILPPFPLPENDKPECDQAKPEDPLMLEPSQHYYKSVDEADGVGVAVAREN